MRRGDEMKLTIEGSASEIKEFLESKKTTKINSVAKPGEFSSMLIDAAIDEIVRRLKENPKIDVDGKQFWKAVEKYSKKSLN